MAKKRKAGGRSQDTSAEVELDPRDSRKRIRTYEDVADSDDEFHLNNDKIRLGQEPDAKRRRQWAEQEEFLEPSDEEILGYSEDEDDDSEVEDERSSAQAGRRLEELSKEDGTAQGRDGEEEEEFGWGTSKADLYGADAIETEEQALEEEAEALRLQKKQLEAMQAADYGFDEDTWQKSDAQADFDKGGRDAVVTEVLPQLQIAPDLGSADKWKLLKSRYPEFDLLSKDLLDLRDTYSTLLKAAESSSVARIKLRAASAYIGAMAMYFSLFTSTASRGDNKVIAMPATQLRDHPIMDSLVKCRDLWTSVEKLSDMVPFANGGSETNAADLGDYSDDSSEKEALAVETQPTKKKSRAERFAEAAQAAHDERRAERLKRTEAGLAELDNLLASTSKRKALKSRAADAALGDDSDIGEEVPLTAREAEDKAKRKKSLRFYTSQIAQKANKRGAAGRNAGGDDDIPHRERLRDRQARLNAEAEKRGKGRADIGDGLGGESDEEDHRQAQQIRKDAEEDDYYDLVAARASKKKGDKAAFADAQRQAALENGRVVQEETVGADGKRKISYAIEKNKGLTPHRKKDVRNPRVKKKKKFEEKKKKLASIKPVYKGGEGRGGYGGELTGIKKGLVKSTKL